MSKKKDKSSKKSKGDAKVVIKVKKTDMITPGAMERVLVWAYCGAIDLSDYTPFKVSSAPFFDQYSFNRSFNCV